LQNVQRLGLPFMRYLLLVTIRLLHRVKKQHAVFGILQPHTLMTNGSEFELCRQLQKSHNYAGYTSLRRGVFLERVPVKTNGSARRRARSVQTALTTERVVFG
jgi:hypothetical protein